ncbi:MAG TPA: formyltetrahydrofolate deformylase [Flavobacterium sp.]|nr:formyltetrahydrofolate deformylase [Flavobacterium sp.]
MQKTTLLIHCRDQKGIIAAVTTFVAGHNGNIVYLDQHVDATADVFFMRLEFESADVTLSREAFRTAVAERFGMSWEWYDSGERPRMALFVSKYDHCLYDLLGRHSSGELHADLALIVSNHTDLQPVAERFGIPFRHVPFTKDIREEGEAAHFALMEAFGIDFIVLARYMQIITPGLIARFRNRIINIHHSFLPAFPGAKPYHSAFRRGVKIIGATSHYVTEELDEGPIIEQDITRVTHSHSIEDFISKGRDLERIVLARAVKLHAERRTIVYDNRTVVFS